MHSARIAELLEPFLAGPAASTAFLDSCHFEPANAGEEPAVLSSAQLHDISTYIDILLRWNARINLTAIRDPEEIVTRHFGESFFAARHLFPRLARVGTGASPVQAEGSSPVGESSARERRRTPPADYNAVGPDGLADDQRPTTNDHPTVADVGSGAGFPGLPIKLWAPHIALTLIESNHKKAAFLREVCRAITLTDVNIQSARAETISATGFNLVALRAVEHFAAILPTAANLVAPEGRLALLISSAQFDQARSSLPQLSWAKVEPIPLSRSKILAIAHRP